jgi:RNA polymerase sigma-70 factor (ECF subfamily)
MALSPEITGDEELLERLVRDLADGFERLVLSYQHRVYAFVLRMVGDPRDAEELAQDTFVRAYRALGGYECDRVANLALRPWLFQIALNAVRNHVRGKRLALTSLDALDPDGPSLDVADDSAGPAVIVERELAEADLKTRLGTLHPRYRDALTLRFVADLSYAEVAETLGQPLGTVKANIHRGLAILRSEIPLANYELSAGLAATGASL